MRLFILGATGKTGFELVDLALARGHEVTAFVRSPGKIARSDPRLRVVRGDPRDAGQMAPALAGHDAVLSALGPSVGEAMTRTTLLRDCASSTLSAMQATGLTRLLVVSSAMLFGGGGALAGFLGLLLREHIRDMRAMERVLEASALQWTIARPPRLVQGRDAAYRAEEGALPRGVPLLAARVSRRAVAAFMLDDLAERRFVRKTVGLCR